MSFIIKSQDLSGQFAPADLNGHAFNMLQLHAVTSYNAAKDSLYFHGLEFQLKIKDPKSKGDMVYIKVPTWNPKQPFINGCLVKQPFSINKDLESSNWNIHL